MQEHLDGVNCCISYRRLVVLDGTEGVIERYRVRHCTAEHTDIGCIARLAEFRGDESHDQDRDDCHKETEQNPEQSFRLEYRFEESRAGT